MSAGLEAFCEYITVIKSLSLKTLEAYRHDLSEIERLTSAPLLQLDVATIFKVLSNVENKRTLNRKLSAINSFLDFCHRSQFDPKLTKFTLAKLPRTLPKYLPYASIMHSLEGIDRSDWLGLRDYALVVFLYATGTRVSECLAVEEGDIEGDWLRVRHGKGERERYIPIASMALRALRLYQEASPFSKRTLWLNYRGEPLSRISAFKITQKYLNVSPHALRHSYATGLILGGADLRVVQELLGHASLLTTQIYTHIQKHNLQQTVQQCHPMGDALSIN